MDIIIDDVVNPTNEFIEALKREIEELKKQEGVDNLELMGNYQYLYNVAWMKVYNELNKQIDGKTKG